MWPVPSVAVKGEGSEVWPPLVASVGLTEAQRTTVGAAVATQVKHPLRGWKRNIADKHTLLDLHLYVPTSLFFEMAEATKASVVGLTPSPPPYHRAHYPDTRGGPVRAFHLQTYLSSTYGAPTTRVVRSEGALTCLHTVST